MDETLQKLYTVLVHFEETDTEITEDENKLRKIKDEIETNLNVSIEKESQSDLIRILKEHQFVVESTEDEQKIVSVPMDEDTQITFQADK
ncbi:MULTISPECIES: hypothetical protein [Staphylococcus]|uniref:Uncharacterized protein n=1 Tax=Staphylococcus agnetis TaxID=985762 RepID=A0A085UI66_9STAP|nr:MULTISPECIES: hypothetical protein [Staphylococcus]ALN76262.1 hypothetical protein EP23_02255 [Staphylococcus agnetis]KFE42879.1 hypothetical protein SAGN_01160 [Staphylococcus agnetis]MBY7663873.1 hypothetical protein [Staphylococcus agnetis]MCO4326942.1 hypothetical protein [Staphylococcus agnetis]MCO4357834.1 hypothetical protein [Staphylococcus agnetis]